MKVHQSAHCHCGQRGLVLRGPLGDCRAHLRTVSLIKRETRELSHQFLSPFSQRPLWNIGFQAPLIL